MTAECKTACSEVSRLEIASQNLEIVRDQLQGSSTSAVAEITQLQHKLDQIASREELLSEKLNVATDTISDLQQSLTNFEIEVHFCSFYYD